MPSVVPQHIGELGNSPISAVVAAGPNMMQAPALAEANKEGAAFTKFANSLTNPAASELSRALHDGLSRKLNAPEISLLGVRPRKIGSPYLQFRVTDKSGLLDVQIVVSSGVESGGRAIAILVNKAPVKGFKPKRALPLKPTSRNFWRQPVASVASDILAVIIPQVRHLLTTTPTKLETPDVKDQTPAPTDVQEAHATTEWGLVFDPAAVSGSDETGAPTEPDVMDYEDAYDDFIEKLNDLIDSIFPNDGELKLHVMVNAEHGERDRAKVDIITGSLAQDLIDTFFPSEEKVMRFAVEGSALKAEVTTKTKGTDTYTFTLADSNEATASFTAIGKWEFFEKLGLTKKATFKDLGIARQPDYASFFKFISRVVTDSTLNHQAIQWINSQLSEKLPNLKGWSLEFRGTAQNPMLMLGNGKVAFALLFKPTEVAVVQSAGQRATTIGKWTWEDRCSRLSGAAVIIYLLRVVSNRVAGEYHI